jgi:hypothetical protein
MEKQLPGKIYYVKIGGQSDDTASEWADPYTAEREALRLAAEIAERYQDTSDIDIYGGEGEEEWGACPDGDDGAYYPVIWRGTLKK